MNGRFFYNALNFGNLEKGNRPIFARMAYSGVKPN